MVHTTERPSGAQRAGAGPKDLRQADLQQHRRLRLQRLLRRSGALNEFWKSKVIKETRKKVCYGRRGSVQEGQHGCLQAAG